MTAPLQRLVPNLVKLALAGRATPRAWAAAFKVCGRRLERRWPYLRRASAGALNLGFADLLELQWARSSDFSALVVGAFDGVANDPACDFIRAHGCRAVFVEPQPEPFLRLQVRMKDCHRVELVNAAIDEQSASRKFFSVPAAVPGLPAWTEQLASFDRDHIVRHEDRAPGVSQHIITTDVLTLSFPDLLDQCALKKLDLLQIDAEGMDAKLLDWFPFERTKPALLYYETVHMAPGDHARVTRRMSQMGYQVFTSESPTDDMAILF